MKKLENTYKELPNDFWRDAAPTAATNPKLIKFNHQLSDELGLDIEESEIEDIFSGKNLPNETSPIAMAYSGHQFGHFVPSLGDGRATLLGEALNNEGIRFDIQLKGSGRTFFSRRGDGLSSLGPVIREYILCESMNKLNIPTTRALCAMLSGEDVMRQGVLPGAIFTRVAKSHIRVGTFEYFAFREQDKNVKKLADYVIDRIYPEVKNLENKYLHLYRSIAKAKLDLVCKWMSVGFIHGVMNTDNTSISGETIDYGPCAFMDHFQYDKVFSSIDANSRYAYNNQGQIALWNLSSLANCFLGLVHENSGEATKLLEKELADLSTYFDEKWLETMGKKFGLFNATREHLPMINSYLKYLQDNNLDFTNSFRALPNMIDKEEEEEVFTKIKEQILLQNKPIDDAINLMNSVNPYLIPRNHLVEKAISDAEEGDYASFQALVVALEDPYIENIELKAFTIPPKDHEVVKNTFCGT